MGSKYIVGSVRISHNENTPLKSVHTCQPAVVCICFVGASPQRKRTYERVRGGAQCVNVSHLCIINSHVSTRACTRTILRTADSYDRANTSRFNFTSRFITNMLAHSFVYVNSAYSKRYKNTLTSILGRTRDEEEAINSGEIFKEKSIF